MARLINESTGKEVNIGDIVKSSRGELSKVTFFRPPHKPGSTGKISVKRYDSTGYASAAEYGVGVFGLTWIEREDQAVCPECDQWADGPNGECINDCRTKSDAATKLINNVLFYLDGHRIEAVEALFPNARVEYHNEWLARDVFGFWTHLDLFNQGELVRLARAHYAK